MHDFNSLSLQQLLEQLDKAGDNVGTGFITEFTKRLINLTYFERKISIEDRKKGEQLVSGLIPEFEKLLKPYPDILKAYQEAYQYQLSNVKYHGYGSLAWKISKASVTGEDVISIIVEPSSGPLIPDFLVAMPSENWAQAKPSVLKTLILDRKRGYESNAALILSGLVCGYDQVAWNVLTEKERDALLNAAKDYTSARNVLAKYELLPKKSVAAPLTPTLEAKFVKLLIIFEIREPFEFLSISDLKEKYDKLNQEEFISVLLWSLRLKLWMDLLEGTYGEQFQEKIEKEIIKEFKKTKKEGFDSFFETLRIADNYRADDSYYGSDISIAAAFSDWYIPKKANEEEQLELTRTVAEIVNYARVNALHKFRFMLRYFAKYPPERGGPDEKLGQYINDKYGDMYVLFGSKVPEAEQQLLFEDWIGYWNP